MSEIYNDGTIQICNLVNSAEEGDMPNYNLESVYKSGYIEREVGINRYYAAQGVSSQVDMLVRIPAMGHARPRVKQYALIHDFHAGNVEDQYRITMVQLTTNNDGFRVYDIQLERLDKNYDTNFN